MNFKFSWRRVLMSLGGVVIGAIAVGLFKIVRLLCLCVGIVVICFYMTADLGVSTYDAVAITMSRKWKLGRFQYIRIATDLVCVILGTVIFVLGGGTWDQVPTIVGLGTIITAFFMGPLIEVFNVNVARPLLKNEQA